MTNPLSAIIPGNRQMARIKQADVGDIVILDGAPFVKVAEGQLKRVYPVVGFVDGQVFYPFPLPQTRPALVNEVINVDGRCYRIVEEGNGRQRWWAYQVPGWPS